MENNIDTHFSENIKGIKDLPDEVNWNKEDGWKDYQKNYSKKKRSNWYKYAAAIVLLLIVAVIILNLKNKEEENLAYDHYKNYINSIQPDSKCELQSNTMVCSSNDGEKCKSKIETGLKQGRSDCFNANGEIITTGSWEAGTRHGEWLVYNENGDVVERKNYIWGVETN